MHNVHLTRYKYLMQFSYCLGICLVPGRNGNKCLSHVVRDTILSGQRNAKSLISLRGLCFVFTKIGFLANNSVQVSGFILILIFFYGPGQKCSVILGRSHGFLGIYQYLRKVKDIIRRSWSFSSER